MKAWCVCASLFSFKSRPDMLKRESLVGLIMISRRVLFRRNTVFFLFCFFAGIIIVLYATIFTYDVKEPFRVYASEAVKDFLVNTSGCQIPAWNPWDESVKSLFKPIWMPYKCSGPPSFLRVLPNAVVSLDLTILNFYYEQNPENVSCVYQAIRRRRDFNDKDVDSLLTLGDPQPLNFDIPLKEDFIRTKCNFIGRESTPIVEYRTLIPLKTDVEERCVNAQRSTNIHDPLNVIFVGLDSISNFNFQRHFSKSRKFLETFLTPIVLNGYVKVGDNTFPNLVPLLTGHFYQHYYDETHNQSMFFDDVDFAWKTFAKLGYRTFFAEDAPDIATFNYYRSGFKHPPADYYYRPFGLIAEEMGIRRKQCLGNQMEMEVLYGYLKNFIDTMGSHRSFFAFLFLARLTHDSLNFAGYADEPTFQLLRYLRESGVLENTMMVFFSDHGIRFGPIRKTSIGQMEERMPFMNILLPKRFLEQHSEMARNLRLNSDRLTTPFDVHATVLHLASLMTGNSTLEPRSGPGISLFREIPLNRTCTKAAISPHWCPCQIHKPVPLNEPVVREAALIVIQTINELTERFRKQCAILYLLHILDSRVAEIKHHSNSTESQINHSLEYLIVLSASPSDALFEATVRCDGENHCKVSDDISRINEYLNQSICIADAELRKFCYCK